MTETTDLLNDYSVWLDNYIESEFPANNPLVVGFNFAVTTADILGAFQLR